MLPMSFPVLQADCPDGQLVISVLRSELLPKAADLLTDTFVDTKGIQAYRCKHRIQTFSWALRHYVNEIT